MEDSSKVNVKRVFKTQIPSRRSMYRLFDPRLYLEPLYVQRLYTWFPNPDKSLRPFRLLGLPSRESNRRVTRSAGRRTDYKVLRST